MLYPVEVVSRAREMLAQQPFVPMSPAQQLDDGRLVWCTAACLARAGLELLRPAADLDAFDRAVAATNDKELVVDAYRLLRWPVEDCREKQSFNDLTGAAERKQAVLALFDSLV